MTEAADEPTVVRMAPCGECPVGTCDECDICTFHASLPGAREHDAIVYPPGQLEIHV